MDQLSLSPLERLPLLLPDHYCDLSPRRFHLPASADARDCSRKFGRAETIASNAATHHFLNGAFIYPTKTCRRLSHAGLMQSRPPGSGSLLLIRPQSTYILVHHSHGRRNANTLIQLPVRTIEGDDTSGNAPHPRLTQLSLRGRGPEKHRLPSLPYDYLNLARHSLASTLVLTGEPGLYFGLLHQSRHHALNGRVSGSYPVPVVQFLFLARIIARRYISSSTEWAGESLDGSNPWAGNSLCSFLLVRLMKGHPQGEDEFRDYIQWFFAFSRLHIEDASHGQSCSIEQSPSC